MGRCATRKRNEAIRNLNSKYSGNEALYVSQMLDSDYSHPSGKSWVQRFEEAFSEKMRVKYAIACNSGTSGLHAALIAAGITSGSEVISPALTVVMDAFATIHVGATPVFADIDPETMNIDPDDIIRKISDKTRAILVVSLQGLSVDCDRIMQIAKQYNLVVVHDTCQTFLGEYKGKIPGSLGDISVWSFENKKHITCGSEGGMITTNNALFAERARKFAGIGYKHLTAEQGRTSLGISTVQDPDYERFGSLGLNYRMNEISAAVGLAQLERAEEIIKKRQTCARYFKEAVADCEWLIPQTVPSGYVNSYYTFACRYYGDLKISMSWKEFYHRYKEMGGDGFYGACKVPYTEPVFYNLVVNGVEYKEGLCPIAEELQPRIMQFKTNYRDMELARKKAEILRELIVTLEVRV